MTIQQITDYCSENYNEISLADHIRIFYNSDQALDRLCTVTNNFHNLMIQSVLDDSENIIEIYIDYREDPDNIICRAFQFDPEAEGVISKIPYIELRNIDFDMGWVG